MASTFSVLWFFAMRGDIYTQIKRSEIMSRVRAVNTLPELNVRRFIFSKGFRFRLHQSKLPGKPDIVLKKYRALVFINGCFWHGHVGCPKSRLPATRTNFWRQKILANQNRDREKIDELLNSGWRVAVVWQCALKRKRDYCIYMEELVKWFSSDSQYYEAPHA